LAFRAKSLKVREFVRSLHLRPDAEKKTPLGLACTAIHNTAQTDLVPPSFFTKLPEHGIIAGLTAKLSITRSLGSSLEEKRPTFAFLRRIRDHPKFSPSSFPRSLDENQYQKVVTDHGETITKLVDEWAKEWLEDARGDEEVEKRLQGMVEEVAWGNVIWFGVGGWQARGTSGRPFNADFFVCVFGHSSSSSPN
jgi:hypothetical protein